MLLDCSTMFISLYVFYLGDVHLVLPALNLSTLNAGILQDFHVSSGPFLGSNWDRLDWDWAWWVWDNGLKIINNYLDISRSMISAAKKKRISK